MVSVCAGFCSSCTECLPAPSGADERSDAGYPGGSGGVAGRGGVGGNLEGDRGAVGEGSLPGFPPLLLILLVAWLPVCALLLFPTSVAPLAV